MTHLSGVYGPVSALNGQESDAMDLWDLSTNGRSV